MLNQYGGRVVKTIGDELMCVLQDAQKACLAATDMQLKITSLPVVEGQQRAIRIGFHAGMVIHQDNDVFGDTVNLAARMTGLAKGGQIMTTAATVLQLPNLLRSSTRKIAALSIKGKEGDIEVCEVIWQAGDELTTVSYTHLDVYKRQGHAAATAGKRHHCRAREDRRGRGDHGRAGTVSA